jgi:hypothetical protein
MTTPYNLFAARDKKANSQSEVVRISRQNSRREIIKIHFELASVRKKGREH